MNLNLLKSLRKRETGTINSNITLYIFFLLFSSLHYRLTNYVISTYLRQQSKCLFSGSRLYDFTLQFNVQNSTISHKITSGLIFENKVKYFNFGPFAIVFDSLDIGSFVIATSDNNKCKQD